VFGCRRAGIARHPGLGFGRLFRIGDWCAGWWLALSLQDRCRFRDLEVEVFGGGCRFLTWCFWWGEAVGGGVVVQVGECVQALAVGGEGALGLVE